jgi:peptide/nickel transport system permease protein
MKNETSQSLSSLAWKKLRKNKLAMFGIFVIAFFMLIAILGYAIMPDDSPNANDMKAEISLKEPGFQVKMLSIRRDEPITDQGFFSRMLFGRVSAFDEEPIQSYQFADNDILITLYAGENFSSYRQNRRITTKRYNLAEVAFATAPNSISSDEKNRIISFYDLDQKKQVVKTVKELRQIIEKNHIVKRTYLLGTDKSGRDMLSRLIIGTRISISVGIISVLISILLGVFFGALGGFFRGKIDDAVMWLINVVWSLPTLLLVVAITFALGKGFWQVFVAVGLTMWVDAARIVRGQVISIREKEFVEAGRALGFGNFRIIARHILPNIFGQIIVVAASNFASAIITEASLSFLGFGAQPPMVSWGKMIRDHINYIDNSATVYLPIIPGMAIMALVLAFLLFGNGLRDALDTRSTSSEAMVG